LPCREVKNAGVGLRVVTNVDKDNTTLDILTWGERPPYPILASELEARTRRVQTKKTRKAQLAALRRGNARGQDTPSGSRTPKAPKAATPSSTQEYKRAWQEANRDKIREYNKRAKEKMKARQAAGIEPRQHTPSQRAAYSKRANRANHPAMQNTQHPSSTQNTHANSQEAAGGGPNSTHGAGSQHTTGGSLQEANIGQQPRSEAQPASADTGIQTRGMRGIPTKKVYNCIMDSEEECTSEGDLCVSSSTETSQEVEQEVEEEEQEVEEEEQEVEEGEQELEEEEQELEEMEVQHITSSEENMDRPDMMES
jgi:hypothetical protein